MLEYLAEYLPKNITDEHRNRLTNLEKSNPELYKETEKFAHETLISIDFSDKTDCEKYGIDYIDFLHPDNYAKIMIAYLELKKSKSKTLTL